MDRGRRYVIERRPITRLELSEKPRIVEVLITEARRGGVRVRLLLMDKGFYSAEVIQKLKSMGVKFLIAAPKNSRVKREIMDQYRSGEGRVRLFSLRRGDDRVEFNLTIHGLRRSKKDLKNILELLRGLHHEPGPYKGRGDVTVDP